ncbi:MAG: YiiX/YebB-like N1pC/P60 family cysteine hydrolase [Rickettsiales bacterium]
MKRVFKYTLLLILTFIVLVSCWVYVSAYSKPKLPELKNGDIVFQTISSPQTLAIMLASGTVYTHVGIVKIGDDGKPVIIEAIGPVREIDIDKWIEQGIGNFLTVKRYKGLKPQEAERIFEAASKYYGRPYDFFFLFDDERIYCSELVYKAFKEGLGIELGVVEKVGDLNINNMAARKLIKQRWQKHPLCQEAGMDFSKCNKVIMNQELVTPASVLRDSKLELIYSNYTPF